MQIAILVMMMKARDQKAKKNRICTHEVIFKNGNPSGINMPFSYSPKTAGVQVYRFGSRYHRRYRVKYYVNSSINSIQGAGRFTRNYLALDKAKYERYLKDRSVQKRREDGCYDFIGR